MATVRLRIRAECHMRDWPDVSTIDNQALDIKLPYKKQQSKFRCNICAQKFTLGFRYNTYYDK